MTGPSAGVDPDAQQVTALQERQCQLAASIAVAGYLTIQLRKLEEAGHLSSEKTRNGSAQKTTVALTRQGRAALSAYTQALRNLLGGL